MMIFGIMVLLVALMVGSWFFSMYAIEKTGNESWAMLGTGVTVVCVLVLVTVIFLAIM